MMEVIPNTKPMFAIFEPITLPKLISENPSKAACKLTSNSGNEVAKETTVNPITILEILNLNDHGVRGVRFNLNRGGSAGVEDLVSMAKRICDLVGWHIELYLGAESLSYLEDKIPALPKVCIDHLGISDSNFEILLNLIRDGLAIKATGFGRVDLNVEETIREIHKVSPDALMFGTDLPSTRARRVYSDQDFYTVLDVLGENEAQKVFSENAINFYGLEKTQA